ncbi:hypothetical protein ACGFZP_22350 [Kitasatospora sp. NPDC048239]|uniref:hypothetical protein n=1 Tax=Kitasatospora sp. NPDC048239 TaxID=3364046 RepID=UPI0037101A0F
MFRSNGPSGFRIPTPRELAEEYGEPVAEVRDTPAHWLTLFGQQRSDGFLRCLDLNYHADRELVAVVQTSRSGPESHHVRGSSTAEGELRVFLSNSGRRDPDPFRDAFTPGHRRVDICVAGAVTTVEALTSDGCVGAQIPCGSGFLTIATTDALWPVVADLVLRQPTDY